MQRSAISRDSVRRSGDFTGAAVSLPVAQRPALLTLQFSIINQAIIVNPILLSAATTDRDVTAAGRSYVSSKIGTLLSLTLNVPVNAATGITTFAVTLNNVATACTVVVGAGATGIFTTLSVAVAVVVGDILGVAVSSTTAVGPISAQCLVILDGP